MFHAAQSISTSNHNIFIISQRTYTSINCHQHCFQSQVPGNHHTRVYKSVYSVHFIQAGTSSCQSAMWLVTVYFRLGVIMNNTTQTLHKFLCEKCISIISDMQNSRNMRSQCTPHFTSKETIVATSSVISLFLHCYHFNCSHSECE